MPNPKANTAFDFRKKKKEKLGDFLYSLYSGSKLCQNRKSQTNQPKNTDLNLLYYISPQFQGH